MSIWNTLRMLDEFDKNEEAMESMRESERKRIQRRFTLPLYWISIHRRDHEIAKFLQSDVNYEDVLSGFDGKLSEEQRVLCETWFEEEGNKFDFEAFRKVLDALVEVKIQFKDQDFGWENLLP